jgi:hypothetical protein
MLLRFCRPIKNMIENSERQSLFGFNSAKDFAPWFFIFVILLLMMFQLWNQGRVWWCQVGDLSPWSWQVNSAHNSQHFIDPYTFTHVLHGILQFWLISLVFRKMPLAWRLALTLFIEGSWEVVENTSAVIERYRAATISLNYYGDSILNSLSDAIACAVGFVLAYKLKFWRSLALFLLTEIILIFWIRDSLLLNIIMLIYPLDSIKNWQAGI